MNQILIGDVFDMIKQLLDQSVHCCVTSPPYWGLRNYNVDGQLGLEPTPDEYVQRMVELFREVWRVLRNDGTVWLNLGDSYAANRPSENPSPTNTRNKTGHYGKQILPKGLKPKDLVGIPWRVAFALQADGWYLRSDIIWHKPNAMPESVRDRPTKAHEYIFLLSKSDKYYYDHEAIKEPIAVKKGNSKTFRGGGKYTQGRSFDNSSVIERESQGNKPNDTLLRNKRTVWTVATAQFPDAHFATFPTTLIEPCVLAGCPEGGMVLDPFCGSGTTLLVAQQHNRNGIGIELNPAYVEIAQARLQAAAARGI